MQYSSARLTWHGGFIPENEIWVKLGGDRGGGIFKATFQIVNVPNPNSVLNICVFCCFMAGDSTYNLHVALDRYKLQVNKLQGMRWRYSIYMYVHYTMDHICVNYVGTSQ